MKKILRLPNLLLLIVVSLISEVTQAQTEKLLEIPIAPNWVKKAAVLIEGQNVSKTNKTFVKSIPTNGISNLSTSIVIGTTTYDLQTNSSMPRRILTYPNKTISVVWNGSLDFNQNPVWVDKGSFYNFFNGTNWNTSPTIRLENKRTGWANLSKVTSGEVCISHINAFTKNTGPGTTWAPTQTVADFNSYTWPRSVSVGDTIYVLLASPASDPVSGFVAPIFFSKSVNGGVTFSQASSTFASSAGYDSSKHIGNVSGDAYAIDAKGSSVAILVLGVTEDIILLKSQDYGVTWSKKIIRKFPIKKYFNGITDLNGDGIADVVLGNSSSGSVLIDNQGIVHVVFSDLPVIDYGQGQGLTLDLTSKSHYFNYWNDSDTVIRQVNSLVDLNGNGKIDYGSNFTGGGIVRYLNAGLSAHPTLSVGAKGSPFQNNIYLTYNAVKDGDTTTSGVPYRNIYNFFTGDKGLTWSNIIDISKTTGIENVFATVDREVGADSSIHIVWQQDFEPGTSLQGAHAPSVSEIVYSKSSLISFTKLQVDFNVNNISPCLENNIFTFYNTSILTQGSSSAYDSIVNIHWDFGDGTTSNLNNPIKEYNTVDTFFVKLKITTLNNLVDSSIQRIIVYPKLDDSVTISSGNEFVTKGSTYEYSIPNQAGVRYFWDVENGTFLSGQSTNKIRIKWDGNKTLGKVICERNNGGDCIDTLLLEEIIIVNSIGDDKEYCGPQSNVLIKGSAIYDTSFNVSWVSAVDTSTLNYTTIPNSNDSNYTATTLDKSVWFARVLQKGNTIDTSESILVEILYPKLDSIYGPVSNIYTGTEYFYSVQIEDGYEYLWSIENGQILSGNFSNQVKIKWTNIGQGQLLCKMRRFSINCSDEKVLNVNVGFSGLNDEKQADFKIYPNPTNDKIFIKSEFNKSLPIKVYSMDGKLLIESVIADELDISYLQKGIYILKVDDIVERIVKM